MLTNSAVLFILCEEEEGERASRFEWGCRWRGIRGR